MAKTMLALVLVDVIAHGVKAGQILEASSDLVQSLKEAGAVDPHKDAVAYAKSQDAQIVRSAIEQAAAQAAAAKAELLVKIAELEDLAGKAEGDSKAALESELKAKREALAQLG